MTFRGRPLAPILLPFAGFFALLGVGRVFPVFGGVLDLALPFFGLIGLGYVFGRIVNIGSSGLDGMNFFIVYVALPALFYNLISATPFDQLQNWRFVIATTLSTYLAFSLAFAVGSLATRGDLRAATIQGVCGSYSNIGYMGPGITLAALGPPSSVPTALIFVFDNILLFCLVPLLMAIGGEEKAGLGRTLRLIATRILTHPFNVATAAGVLGAWGEAQPPVAIAKMLTLLQGAAAPAALFVMGVTIALRPVRRVAPELPALTVIKLVVHPLIVWAMLSLIGDFSREWTYTAILMAALPPALNVFVLANQYRAYVERASSTILFGTLISVVTVTGLLYLMSHDAIPVRPFRQAMALTSPSPPPFAP